MPEPHLKAVPIETAKRQTELPQQYPKGRRCSSCDRFLSVWNSGPSCYACEEAMVQFKVRQPLMLDQGGRA